MSVSQTGIVPGGSSDPDSSPQTDVTDISEIEEISEETAPAGGAVPGAAAWSWNGQARAELPGDRYLDREQSWVLFNQRVLELAEDDQTPLLERVRFLAIFASNLDEFFMVRVAGLMRRMAAGLPLIIPSGLTPGELLKSTLTKSGELASRHAAVFANLIKPELARHDIEILRWKELTGERARRALRAVQEPDLPGSHAACGGPGAPVPVHLRAVAQPRGHPHRPGQRPDDVRPGQGPAVAAALPERQPLPIRPDRGRDRRAPEPAVRRHGHHRALRLPGDPGPRARGRRGRHREPAPGDGARAGQAALRARGPARGRAGHVATTCWCGWPGSCPSTPTRSTKAARSA